MKRLPALTLVFGLVVGAAGGAAFAAFSSQTNPVTGTFSSKRIYSGARATTAFNVDDAADGTTADVSALMAFDGSYHTSDIWTSGAFNTGRYFDVELNSSLPAGLVVTNPTVTVRFADNLNTGADNFCYYLDVRRISTGAVLGTYGSAASPLGCEAVSVLTTINTAIPAVTTTDDLNDVRVRIYGRQTAAARARFDRITVSAGTYGSTSTLYPIRHIDVADGTAATTNWGVANSGDGAALLTAGNWATTFSTTRYVSFSFPKYVPAGAQVTSVSVDHAYRSNTAGDTTCWYLDARRISDGAVLGTHGSAAAPISCNSTTSYVSNNVALPEIDTGAEAGDLLVRVYARNTGTRRSQHDLVRLNVTYSLPEVGCSDPGQLAVQVSQDSFADQVAPSATNGTSVNVRVRSQTANQNRRAFLDFTLPTLADGCSVTLATLWMYINTPAGVSRTIEARRVLAPWDEATLTWANQPATDAPAGTTATPTSANWDDITVTSAVQAMYASGAYGLMLRDSAEGSATAYQQSIDSSESGNGAWLLVDQA